MLVGITPKIKKNYTEYEYSIDINLIKFVKFLYQKLNVKYYMKKKI